MSMIGNRQALALAVCVTGLAASCENLPNTAIKPRAGSSGASANAAGNAGVAGKAAGGMGNAATAGSATSMAGGDTAGDSSGTGGGTGGTGGTGGKSSSSGKSGGAGKSTGTGGSANGDAGNGGEAPSAGAPSGGDNGGSGRTYSTNRADFFGAPRCDGMTFALCDDFEAAALNGRWQTQTSTGSTIQIDGNFGARGLHSAHFHTEDNGLALVHQTATFPAPNDTYYGRLFVYFDTMPTVPDWAHWSIVGAQAADADAEIRVGGQFDPGQNKNLFGVGTDHGVTGDWTNLDADDGSKPVPERAWVCVEWMHDGDHNETKFWWDGVEHPSLATTSTKHGGTDDPYELPQFDSMWVGWWLYQAGTTPDHFDVWIDEVAIDYERIGCGN